MNSALEKITKELLRFQKRFFVSRKKCGEEEKKLRELNAPYEQFANEQTKSTNLKIPIVKNADQTLSKIISERSSLVRFGDGEFSIMRGGGIHFQKPSKALASKLIAALQSSDNALLVALPDCFGTLVPFESHVAMFWRKWLVKKRLDLYKILDLDKTYYSAFFTRVFMPYKKTPEHYAHCAQYFERCKKIWLDRKLVICEGEGTRFGVLNDLLNGAQNTSRILCPATNAFDRYPEILSACEKHPKDTLFLIALGPTATALAYDLFLRGYQVIDIGHLDVEYEWFLRKDEKCLPLEHKYVDGSAEGRKIHLLENKEYEQQIIERIL